MEEQTKFQRGMDKFADFSARVGNQVHLRSLRDAFTTLMPIFILAGLAVLFNSVLFPFFIRDAALLEKFQVFGNAITNGTLNISSLLIAPMIAYYLSKNKNYPNPIDTIPMAVASLVIMMAMQFSITPVGTVDSVVASGVLPYSVMGTQGMFAGIIIGLLSTEVFIRFASFEKIKIHMPDGVPPAVGKSFNVLIPSMLSLMLFALVAALLSGLWSTDLITLISNLIQEPFRRVGTSLPGYLLIFTTGNALFSVGIHQTVINGSILDPLLLVNMNENMEAVSRGDAPTNILNTAFNACYTMMGGTGATISLVIILIFFTKFAPYKAIGGLSVGPGIFNINEPIIFGLPIVFNIPMMIPFVLAPVIAALIGYFATAIGFVEPLSVLIPWTTPPFISGMLASGGDWKVVLVQIVIIVVVGLFYIPFVQVSIRQQKKQMEMAEMEQ